MRPKVVILTLVLAFAVLAGMILLKGVKRGADVSVDQPTNGLAAMQSQPASDDFATNQLNQPYQKPLDTNAAAALAEKARTAEVDRQLEEISDLLSAADGDNNATVTIPALLDKVAHPEAEVRKAALDALKQLNDTNAVPGLLQALEKIKDPREKVAVLDTIDYLKLPGITPDVTPENATNNTVKNNSTTAKPGNTARNPNFVRGRKNNGLPAAPAAAQPGADGQSQ
jgi:hypothetical protein